MRTLTVGQDGTLNVPPEILAAIGCKPGDAVTVDVRGFPRGIIITLPVRTCQLCGQTAPTWRLRSGRAICDACLAEVAEVIAERAESGGR